MHAALVDTLDPESEDEDKVRGNAIHPPPPPDPAPQVNPDDRRAASLIDSKISHDAELSESEDDGGRKDTQTHKVRRDWEETCRD